MPSYISPTDFWNLSLTELDLIGKNIRQRIWDEQYSSLYTARVLACDISKVLAGKSFESIEHYLAPNPRGEEVRSDEEIEATLMMWARQGDYGN